MTAGFTRIISLLAIVALTARVASSLRVRDQLSEPTGACTLHAWQEPRSSAPGGGPRCLHQRPLAVFSTAEHDPLMVSTGVFLSLVRERGKRGLAIGREGATKRAFERIGEVHVLPYWHVPQSRDGSSHRPDDGTLNLTR